MNITKIYLIKLFILTVTFCLCLSCTQQKEDKKMDQLINQFAPTEITFDTSLLDSRQMKVVEELYKAALIMDGLFLDQVYSGNREWKAKLEKSGDSKALEYFNIMFGPFDRLNNDQPFLGDQQKPEGANFYPEDMTKKEFEAWIESHPEDREAFMSEFTMIRRKEGRLVAIPYSEYYRKELTEAADYLREAAKYADNESLKRYLQTRADAFLSNEYFESDMAWMDLKDHTIEVVIGPYEVYEDKLFNYKAAFECFITLKDPRESEKLNVFANYLTDIERNLPIPDKYKNFDRGSESPIMVVQEVFSAGDTKAGVQTLAFNLPNDERVREAKGSKKVMLKNLHEAKFEKQLLPIARLILDESQLAHVNFEAFFNHTLMHEISHGVGPGNIVVDGRKTDVKTELEETYSKIEECKADILGMYNNLFMIEKGIYPAEIEKSVWTTFLAGIMRSVRFGIEEAHGAGNAVIFNYLLKKGAYEFDERTKRVRVNFDKIYAVLTELAAEILTLQAEGDYQKANEILESYAIESPEMRALVAKLEPIPVDIKPVFQIEKILDQDSNLK